MEVVIFLFAAAGALAGGVGVIASQQAIRSALSLLLVLGSLAIMYLLLAAQFIAVLQVIVYAGAIVVLFLFVIMLIHAPSGEVAPEKLHWQRPAGLTLAAIFLAILFYTLKPGSSLSVTEPAAGFGTAESVGRTLFTTFLLPFEVASVLLLVGIVAAVVIGRPSVLPAAPPPSTAKTPAEVTRR